MRYAASFTVHAPSTPSTHVNITPVARREEAIQRGLKRRLEQLSEERERRARAAAAADEDFSAEFLTMARQVFDMIDVDESGYLDKDEIIDAVKANKKVINFLQTCGNQNLMYLLEPARLQQALAVLDTDRDGQIDASEWEDAIENALKAKLQARAAQRRAQEMMARQAAKELEEFTNEFKNAARHCFELIDVDKGGSLSKEEIVNAVHPKTGIEKVIKFLKTCGEENLQFLLHPPRLQKALEILDTDKSGEVDADEWRVAASYIWFQIVRLTSFRAQGGGHQPGPREAHRAAQGRAGAAGAGRGRGRQRILRGVPQRGSQGLPPHRQGRERDAREG